jgi:hypothetical protein
MSRAERRALVEREASALPVSQQCRLLAVSRASVYRRPAEISEEDCTIMALIDRQYLVRPYYGSRRMAAWLATPAKPKNRGSANRFSRRAKARHRPGLRNPPENSRNRRSTPVSGIETLGGTFDVKKPIDYLS